MKSLTDQELLRGYCDERCEAAFSELVSRHVDLVYSSALRIVRDSQLAEDVTQHVFLVLAQNAASLSRHPVLVGWLHRTTQNLASNVVRQEVRRQAREQKAICMTDIVGNDDPWRTIEPHIEEALGELRDDDRNLVLHRFFYGKSAREIAAVIGTAEGAAQKRLTRAMEKLRRALEKRGVSIGGATLGASLCVHGVEAAPSGLAAAVSKSVSPWILDHAITASVTKGIAMSAAQKAIVAVSVSIAVGVGIFEVHQAHGRKDRAGKDVQTVGALIMDLDTLRAEHAAALAQIEDLRAVAERLGKEAADVHQLRAEMARLRGAAALAKSNGGSAGSDATETALTSWLNKTDAFKQAQHRLPEKAIPELALLTELDWLELAKKNGNLLDGKVPPEDFETNRKLLNLAREKAKMKFGFLLSGALTRYCEANGNMLPSNIAMLRPYFEDHEPHLGGSAEFVKDEMLERYEILQSGAFTELAEKDTAIMAEAAPADQQGDTRLVVGHHWLVTASAGDPGYWRD